MCSTRTARGSSTVSPDRRWLFTAHWGRDEGRLWDLETGEVVKELTGPYSRGTFSPDGRRFVAVLKDGFKCLEAGSWETRWIYKRGFDDGMVMPPKFTPDSRTVALTYSNDSVHLLDVDTGERLAILQSADGVGFWRCDFNSDGSELLLALREPFLVTWKIEPTRAVLRKMDLDW